jgi:hypothetical protein
MSNVRVIAGLSLIVLSSCSMFGSLSAQGSPGGGAKSSGSPASEPSKIAGPSVQKDASDSPDVEHSIKRLAHMEQMIGAREFVKYAQESRDFQAAFLRRGWLADEKKHDVIKARLDALDAAAFAAFGGRLAKLGDARRVVKLDSDAVEAAQTAVETCTQASKMSAAGNSSAGADLAKAIGVYEKAMARAVKLDANALHYDGERTNGGTIDVPTQLMECEVALVGTTTQFEDEYIPEPAVDAGFELGCGLVEWTAEAVQIGNGQFAAYTRSVSTTSALKPVPCKSIPARSNAPKGLAGASGQFAEHIEMRARDLIEVVHGQPTIEVNKEDLHTYRYQRMRAYSKVHKFDKNPCGDKIFCEAGGSEVMAAYNRMEFAFERATAHAGNNPELCKGHLKTAKMRAEWFEPFRAGSIAKHDWIAGATYKTKKGAKLSEKQLIAAFAEAGQRADDRLDDRYCNKPAK